MRQSALRLLFKNGTYTLGDVKFRTVGGKLVMANIIRKPIIELSHSNCGVEGLFELCRQKHRRTQEYARQNLFHEIFFHIGSFRIIFIFKHKRDMRDKTLHIPFTAVKGTNIVVISITVYNKSC